VPDRPQGRPRPAGGEAAPSAPVPAPPAAPAPLPASDGHSRSVAAPPSVGPGRVSQAAPDWRPWRFRMSNDLWGSPTVRDGLLYVTSFEVHALDVASGRRQFKTREVAWTMAVSGGRVLATDGTSLYALDSTDGADRWRQPTEGRIYALGAERGTVLTAARGGTVQAWEAANGERLWDIGGMQAEFESPDTGPVIADGTVYTWGDEHLYALQARTGDQLWRHRVGDPSVTGGVPVRVHPGTDGMVYAAAGSRVFALDAATGGERWRFDAPAAVLCPPVHAPAGLTGGAGGIFFTDYLGTVYALDPHTGDDRWRLVTEPRQSPEPVVVADGLVHVGSGSALYTLDAASGTPRWRFGAGEAIVGSPVAADGRVHFGSEDFCLYTLDAASGRLTWKLKTGGAITGSPVASGGMVFACSADRCVYALDAALGTARPADRN
ncbi:PQQ-binding-like beta-propeller repeat protein, partial [Streptomyces sp. YIM 98790]|uniref:outer membrane protein assembly factor BamB family protein n=1 Tax=Streptomyces sp. YIM 98790 TaxID=2689077 RepID=UPI001407FD40